MAWTYSGDPTASTTDEVRFLIQDTDTNDQLVQDAEIAYMLASKGSALRAAAAICRQVALKLGRELDIGGGGLGSKSDEKYQHYMSMAESFDTQASRSGGVNLFAGGISQAQKDTTVSDADRVPPSFTVDLHDEPSDSGRDELSS